MHAGGGDGIAVEHAGDVALGLDARLGGGGGEGGGGGAGHVTALDAEHHLPNAAHVHASPDRLFRLFLYICASLT